MNEIDTTRPYLVIPKLIEQPTWGGEYIADTKVWHNSPTLKGKKIGQSYELFSGSNLSLCKSSTDPDFVGELADRDSAQVPSSVPNSVPLRDLVAKSPQATLGKRIAEERGDNINLLIKFTQALGNSFQVHLKDGQTDPYWKPKPESWYFFEPGLITVGVRADKAWQAYQDAAKAMEAGMQEVSEQIRSGQLDYDGARPKIDALIKHYDPWQFVNRVEVAKDAVVDVSVGGVHHSWEEDTQRLPLGNVLYELQTEAMDDVSTLRSFDRGKIGRDGSLRDLHINDYFRLIDRSPEANDPATFMREPELLESGEGYTLESLLKTKYYRLKRLTLKKEGASYEAELDQFMHLFVKAGVVTITTPGGAVRVGTGHSCFVPAAAQRCTVLAAQATAEVLISE